ALRWEPAAEKGGTAFPFRWFPNHAMKTSSSYAALLQMTQSSSGLCSTCMNRSRTGATQTQMCLQAHPTHAQLLQCWACSLCRCCCFWS
ncbi:hypothetical protein GGI22_007279, partial [Coemansia erecta]